MDPQRPAARPNPVFFSTDRSDLEAGSVKALLTRARAAVGRLPKRGLPDEESREPLEFMLGAVQVALRRADGAHSSEDLPSTFGDRESLFKSAGAQAVFGRYLREGATQERREALRAVETALDLLLKRTPVGSMLLTEVERVAREVSGLLP